MTATSILGLLIQASLFLVVLSYGLQARFEDVVYLFRRSGQLFRALLSINLIMPLFVIGLIGTFDLDPVVEVALLALSVSPVPPVLPNKALKSGGGKSFTIGLLVAVSILSIGVIPMLFRIMEAAFGRTANFSVDTILRTILIGVVIPLAVGMLSRHIAPAISERYAGIVGKIGLVVLILGFLPILFALVPDIWSLIGNGAILAIIGFTLVGMTVGHLLGGPNPHDRTVVALATASRHPAIAIALASANVGEGDAKLAAAAVLLYSVVSGIVSVPYLKWLSAERRIVEERHA